jgi:hypothetical protein
MDGGGPDPPPGVEIEAIQVEGGHTVEIEVNKGGGGPHPPPGVKIEAMQVEERRALLLGSTLRQCRWRRGAPSS